MRAAATTRRSSTRRWAAGLALLVSASVLASCVPPAPEPPTEPPTEPPPTAPTPASAAMWLLQKAAAAGAPMAANYVMSKLGLNSLLPVSDGQKLDEIKAELDAISAKLDQVNRSLNTLTGQFAQNALTVQLTALRDESRDVGVLYNEQFRPMLTAGIEHEKAKESGDQQRIDAAFDQLIRRRNQFYVAYDRLGASSLAGKISDRLVPGESTSALSSKGLVLLTRPGARYYNAASSAEIRAVYDNFAEYEALAAWMRMERWIPSNPPPPGDTKEGIIENFETARREYLAQTLEEHTGLPPVIPADVAIDAGTQPLAATSPTMWQPVASAVRYRPNHSDPGSVPALLAGLNADAFRSYGDWQIPSRADVNTLLSGFTPATGTTPNTYLAGLHATSAAWQAIKGPSPWPYVWTRDVAITSMSCLPQFTGTGVTINVPRQFAVTTATPTSSTAGQPPLPGTVRGDLSVPPSCADFLDSVFAGAPAAGGFLAARTMDATWTDFLGQRSGPYVRHDADLRLADLSDRYLSGIDAHGSDLRGAKLTDTDLSGANLRGVDLRGANLTGTDLNDADLTDAKLAGVTTSRIEGRPKALPAGWTVANGHLIGPGVALTGADLREADLRSTDLTGANFADTDLTGANLAGVQLTGANLTRAHLVDVDLTGARLTATTLSGATFQGATLRGVSSGSIVANAAFTLPAGWRFISGQLAGPGANLTGGNLSGVNLTGLDLSQADLTGARLTNATLTNVRLTGATVAGSFFGTDDDNKFQGVVSGGLIGVPAQLPASGRYRLVEGHLVGPSADLTGATFSPAAQLGVSLSATNFTNADLTGVNLTGAFMNNANLTGAVLTGATLSGVNLSAATLTGVVSGGIVGNPVLPPGWTLVDGFLVDPGAGATSAGLAGAHTSGAGLDRDLVGAADTGR